MEFFLRLLRLPSYPFIDEMINFLSSCYIEQLSSLFIHEQFFFVPPDKMLSRVIRIKHVPIAFGWKFYAIFTLLEKCIS